LHISSEHQYPFQCSHCWPRWPCFHIPSGWANSNTSLVFEILKEWNNYSFSQDSKHNLLTLSDSVIISNCFSLITVIYLIYDYSLLWTKFDTVFCRKASTGRSGSRNSGHSSQPCSVGDQWSYCTQAQVWLWHSNRGVSLETSGRSLSNPRAV